MNHSYGAFKWFNNILKSINQNYNIIIKYIYML